MRRLGQALALCIFLLLLLLIKPWQWIDHAQAFLQDLREQSAIGDARASVSYLLDKDKALLFPLPAATAELRLLTHAALPIEKAQQEGDIRYAIHYQLLDSNQNVLLDQIYHHRTVLSAPLIKNEQTTTYPIFFADAKLVPTLAQPQIIAAHKLQDATHIRINLYQKDAVIEDVAIRVYYQQKVQQTGKAYQWERLSRYKKQSLAGDHIFGVNKLNNAEKIALLRVDAQPIGPDGNEGEDFHSRKLYRIDKKERVKYAPVELASGRYIDKTLYGVVAIKSHEKNSTSIVNLELRRLSATEQQGPVELLWQSSDGKKMQRFTLTLDDKISQWSGSLAAGLLEIRSPTALIFNARQSKVETQQDDSADSLDLLTELKYLRTWQLGSEALTFKVYPAPKEQAEKDILRIDLRHIAKQYQQQQRVDFKWIDDIGEIIQEGTLDYSPTASLYDWLSEYPALKNVSEASHFYLPVPRQAVQLELQGPEDTVVSFYTRPAGLAKRLYLPMDYQRVEKNNEAQPNWFISRPTDWQRHIAEQRAPLIALQKRFKTLDQNILSGQYKWTEARAKNAHSRDILMPKSADAPMRKEAVSSTFYPLRANQNESLTLPAMGLRAARSPSLIFQRKSAKRATFSYTLNAEKHQLAIVGFTGEINLPLLKPGQHQINIKSDANIDWYINHLQPQNSSKVFQKRSVYRLNDKALVLTFEKRSNDKEVLLLQFYADANSYNKTAEQVSIIGSEIKAWHFSNNASAGKTLLKRQFHIDLKADDPSINNTAHWPVFSTSGKRVQEGRRLFIPFEADLAAGKYSVIIRLLDGVPGYLSAYSIAPGAYQQQKFYKDIK